MFICYFKQENFGKQYWVLLALFKNNKKLKRGEELRSWTTLDPRNIPYAPHQHTNHHVTYIHTHTKDNQKHFLGSF